MDIQIVDNETVTEPISIAEAKSYLQIDQDYAADDGDIAIALTSARQRLESYLNIGLAKRSLTVYWNGTAIELPRSPTGDITEVKKNDELLVADDYHILPMPAKRICVNNAYSYPGEWFYSMDGYVEYTPSFTGQCNDVYSVKYQTGYETLPTDLKQAILAETHHIFNLRGFPVSDVISPNAALLASNYSRNLIL